MADTDLEGWIIDRHPIGEFGVGIRHCVGKGGSPAGWWAELYPDGARCYKCRKPVPPEVLDAGLLAGVDMKRYPSRS